jgi:hypothetical protein
MGLKCIQGLRAGGDSGGGGTKTLVALVIARTLGQQNVFEFANLQQNRIFLFYSKRQSPERIILQ